MNVPYVKNYNADGVCENHLESSYMHSEPNRAKRRELSRSKRFRGNGRNFHLTVTPQGRYHRAVQVVAGSNKRIEHYVSIKNKV